QPGRSGEVQRRQDQPARVLRRPGDEGAQRQGKPRRPQHAVPEEARLMRKRLPSPSCSPAAGRLPSASRSSGRRLVAEADALEKAKQSRPVPAVFATFLLLSLALAGALALPAPKTRRWLKWVLLLSP